MTADETPAVVFADIAPTQAAAGAPDRPPMLSIRHLVKKFGGLTAVDDVSLDVFRGEVVGLVGDNGAGKSTLIKCVAGVHQPNAGEVFLDGVEVHFSQPLDARRAGIETIYQDLALAGNLAVSANIFLGRELKRRHLGGIVRTLDEDRMLQESRTILASLGITIPRFSAEIEKLSGGQRQAVAIARAIYWNARLMIMDEPTNNLGVPEQRKVLDLIRTLRDQRVPVILISHTLPDVFAVADRIVIMHRGRKVAEMPTSETDSQQVVEYMVGARQQAAAAA
jgi:ABC-type sugar transport system ATPase subunit